MIVQLFYPCAASKFRGLLLRRVRRAEQILKRFFWLPQPFLRFLLSRLSGSLNPSTRRCSRLLYATPIRKQRFLAILPSICFIILLSLLLQQLLVRFSPQLLLGFDFAIHILQWVRLIPGVGDQAHDYGRRRSSERVWIEQCRGGK